MAREKLFTNENEYAQKNAPEAERMRAMIPAFNTSKAQLLFNGDESIFKNLPQEEDIHENAGDDGRRMVFRMGGGDNETYKNFANEILVE